MNRSVNRDYDICYYKRRLEELETEYFNYIQDLRNIDYDPIEFIYEMRNTCQSMIEDRNYLISYV